MKLALVQQTGGSGTGNQDYLDAVFASDVKLALSFNTVGTANNTAVNNSSFSEGATTASAQRVSGNTAPNGAASAGAMTSFTHSSTSGCIAVPDNNSATPNSLAAFGSFQATGLRANWSTAGQAALVNMLLWGGSDVEISLVNATLNTGASPVTTTVAHGLSGGAPHAIMAFSGLGSSRVGHGFHHVGDATYACASYCILNGTNPTSLGGYVGNDSIIAQANNSTVQYKLTLANIGATNVDLVATGGTIEADVITLVFIRSTTSVFRVGVHTAPTSPSTVNVFPDSRSATWKGLILLPSRIVTVNTQDGGDAAGVYGMGVAVDNAGSTQQMCASVSSDDGAATSVERSVTSNTKALQIMDIAGALDIEATLDSWGTTNPQLNYSNVSAAAVLIPYFAIGEAIVGGSGAQGFRDRFVPGIGRQGFFGGRVM